MLWLRLDLLSGEVAEAMMAPYKKTVPPRRPLGIVLGHHRAVERPSSDGRCAWTSGVFHKRLSG